MGFPSTHPVVKPLLMKLQIKNLSVNRGDELIVSDITFAIATGEALVVRGANGVGKSTLLRALAGLLTNESGSIDIVEPEAEFEGRSVADLCHYLGGNNAMKPALSVEENLQFWQDFCGNPHLDIDEALDMVGLDGLQSVPFAHLSTGQRRRIAIARLLVSYRPIWILDEPTSGLDAASEKQFSAFMQAHLEDDGLIIAATHIPLGLAAARELELEAVTVEPDL